MRVRYNPVVGVVFVVLGAVCTFFGLWLFMLGEFSPALVIGLIPMLIGVLYLVRPYFWVEPGSVTVPALGGPMRREFPYEHLEADGGKLIAVNGDGTRKKLPIARWLAHSDDWQAATTEAR